MSHIFRQEEKTNQDNQGIYYCFQQEDFVDDDGLLRTNRSDNQYIIAKAIANKKPKHFSDQRTYYRYYIKTSPNLEIFNPIKLYSSSDPNKQEFSYINNICKNSWIFKEVDKLVFDQYLLFLKTKNVQTYKDIQRQLK